jgi:hypothetical protein
MAALDPKRWTRAVVVFVALVLVGGLIASLASVAGSSGTSQGPVDPNGGPSQADLDALAADLSSGDRERVLGGIADIPIESADEAFESLGSLTLVRFDPASVRYDAENEAALVDADLTASDGSVRSERLVLVERLGRWVIFSTLQVPDSTPIPSPR